MEEIKDAIVQNIKWIILSIFIIPLFFCFTIVQPGEEAVVLRLKKYNRTMMPGFNLKIPFIEQSITVQKYKYRKINLCLSATNNERTMITGDENLVAIQAIAVYNIKDTKNFLFNLEAVEKTIQQVGESVLRDTVSSSQLTNVISNQKVEIEATIKQNLQQILDLYESGVNVMQIQLLKASSPTQETENAYREVQAAKALKEKLINIGLEYKNRQINIAQGEKEKIILEAQKFYQSKKAETEKFIQEFNAYRAAYKKLDNPDAQKAFLNIMRKNAASKILQNKNITIVPTSTLNHKKV